MLKIVLTHKILGPPQSVALGVKFFSLMVNPRLIMSECSYSWGAAKVLCFSQF